MPMLFVSTITHKCHAVGFVILYNGTVGDIAGAFPTETLWVQVLDQLAGDALGQAVLHQGRLWKRSES